MKDQTNKPTSLSVEQAEMMAKFKWRLDLDDLTELSDDVAFALGKHRGTGINLNGLTTLSEEAANSLTKCKGNFFLNGLTTLSNSVAGALAKHRNWLSLDGITSLSDEAAEAFAKPRRGLLESIQNGSHSTGSPRSREQQPQR